MNNLHRELAPVSDAAWAEIEEETTRTLKRYLAGRHVVDVPSPGGIALPGVGTGHLKPIAAPAEGILASRREVKPLVELRVPFELSRGAIDDVERGSRDSDWQPAKGAAKMLAFAEDRAIFNGYPEAEIRGIRESFQFSAWVSMRASIAARCSLAPSTKAETNPNSPSSFSKFVLKSSSASAPGIPVRSMR